MTFIKSSSRCFLLPLAPLREMVIAMPLEGSLFFFLASNVKRLKINFESYDFDLPLALILFLQKLIIFF